MMADEEVYGSRPIKARSRRKRAEIGEIKAAIFDLLSEDNPQTVRQVFYALTVRGAIQKTEMEYKATVVRLLGEMREAGEIPFDWIADNTRWMRKPTTFSGLQSCLDATAKLYRRNLWNDSDHYVEVWCEKDALAGVIVERDGCIRRAAHDRERLRLSEFPARGGDEDHGHRQARYDLPSR
jgi:hypothetical protein